MIFDIWKLKKEDDLLNSEGTILGLYKLDTKLYLGSYLKDGSGMVYYSTELSLLKKYFNSEIRLNQLYSESEDFIVARKYRDEVVSFLKQDLVNLIKCGDKLYSELSDALKNRDYEKRLYGS